MNKKIKDYLVEKVEKRSMKIAETSSRRSCASFVYEPKSPFVTMQKKESK